MAARRGSQRSLLALVAALACCLLPWLSLAQPIEKSQGAVLRDLQDFWSRNFTGWRTGGDCKQAQGLTCDGDGMITSMRFNTSSVVYVYPTTVTQLSRLAHLEFTDVDHIPWGSLYNITWLKSLTVECYPYMIDSIPDGVANLTQLTRLRISSCGFENQLHKLSRLTSLVELEVPSNKISYMGEITSTNFPRLVKLNLSSNLLTTDNLLYLKTLTSLTTLDLSSNLFKGDLVVQNISLPTLQFLSLSNNQLTGSLPESLTNMTNLVSLSVDFNYMDGTISPDFGRLTNLSALSTKGTSLTCPDSYSSCGVPQNESSGFCQTCSDFCTTCDKPKPTTEAPPADDKSKSGFPMWAIVVIVVAAVAVVVALAIIVYYFCFNKTLVSSKAASQVCREYSLQQVVRATNNWSEANLLGAGAFGDVYRAVSPADGATLWAVKRAKIITNDFDTEVCQMATKHHPNLVRLLGFSIGITDKTRVEQILIYELMPHGDLQQWIGKGAAVPLSFQQRVDILMGAARGFEYLHSFGIVHRDIKPANILLDQNMQAKISDFGLVRKGEGTTVQSTRVVGTPGYVDPSYSASNKATTAADVYSFGVLMLELMTGRHVAKNSLPTPSDEEAGQQMHIVPWVTQQFFAAPVASLKDPRMAAQDDLLLKVLQLALRCTAKHSASRPAMGAIAAELEAVMVELGGSRSNAAALQVDRQVEARSVPANLDADLARLTDMFQGNLSSSTVVPYRYEA
ncbi:hypothetical protein CLOM_g14469 [Closterium sp. NIES-68]|nr:hypothetical protein CLOM_g14469 [Closterium sp. NIES-68]GJP81489.1 hypothetical protein CLOP_g11635 [Closterium sp. NIES-67]